MLRPPFLATEVGFPTCALPYKLEFRTNDAELVFAAGTEDNPPLRDGPLLFGLCFKMQKVDDELAVPPARTESVRFLSLSERHVARSIKAEGAKNRVLRIAAFTNSLSNWTGQTPFASCIGAGGSWRLKLSVG